jgi:ribosomal protein S18 acetylase RimI-like enzyme
MNLSSRDRVLPLMNTNLLDIKFGRIGARLKITDRPTRRTSGVISLNVQTHRKGEFFESDRQPGAEAEIAVLDVQPCDRHLLLLAREGKDKSKFLCGHDSPAYVLLAEVEDRVVGSIIGAFDGWRGNIYRLAVHLDCRRQGIARALVAEVEKSLAGQKAKRITALVEKDQPRGMSLWEAVGYRVDERIVRRVRTL